VWFPILKLLPMSSGDSCVSSRGCVPNWISGAEIAREHFPELSSVAKLCLSPRLLVGMGTDYRVLPLEALSIGADATQANLLSILQARPLGGECLPNSP
jgi:hypothetical protein